MNLEKIINSKEFKIALEETKGFDILHIDATSDNRGIDFDFLMIGKGPEDKPIRMGCWIPDDDYCCVSGML